MSGLTFSRLATLTVVASSEIMAALDERVHINPLEIT